MPLQQVLRILVLAISVLGAAGSAWAAPLPETLLWDASAAGSDPANTWQSSVGVHDWNITGATHGTTSSAYSGITHSYAFDGVNDRGQAASIESFGGTGENTSFELWFRPTDFLGGQQVLFETGGRVDGLSITLDDANLLFRVQDDRTNFVSLVFDLSSDPFLVDPTEFIQVIGSIDLDDTAELFVNGTSVATGSASGINDWAGAGGAGLGDVSGRVGGTNGAGEGDLFGYGAFSGELALLRFYQNQIFSEPDAGQNFDEVTLAPEPQTAFLLGMGLVLLGLRRRRELN